MATIPSVYSTYNGIAPLALTAPTAPTITSTGTASNLTQLTDALQTPGVQVTTDPGSSITAGTFDFNITDIHLILGAGSVLRTPNFGNGGTSRVGNRLRISGSGQMHQAAFSGTWNDLLLQDFNATGPATVNSHAISINDNPATRVALIGLLGRAGQSFFIGDTYDGVMAGCSIQAGATPGTTSEPAWVFRGGNTGWMIAFQNEMRTNRFHPYRSHPNSNNAREWVSQNIIVHREESKAFTVDARMASHTGISPYAGYIANTFYGETGSLNCSCPVNGGNVVTRAEVMNNTFNLTGASDSSVDLAAAVTAVKSGNTYNATAATPAWTRDPTGLNIAP
jgi:hypothetical protein